MFDIGFWEMVLIAIVALVVVGPKELPGLIRGVSAWVSQARKVAGEFKEEFSREVARAEEIKRLVERETELAELHKALEEARATVSIDALDDPARGRQAGESGAAAPDAAAIGAAAAESSRQDAPSSGSRREDSGR